MTRREELYGQLLNQILLLTHESIRDGDKRPAWMMAKAIQESIIRAEKELMLEVK